MNTCEHGAHCSVQRNRGTIDKEPCCRRRFWVAGAVTPTVTYPSIGVHWPSKTYRQVSRTSHMLLKGSHRRCALAYVADLFFCGETRSGVTSVGLAGFVPCDHAVTGRLMRLSRQRKLTRRYSMDAYVWLVDSGCPCMRPRGAYSNTLLP